MPASIDISSVVDEIVMKKDEGYRRNYEPAPHFAQEDGRHPINLLDSEVV